MAWPLATRRTKGTHGRGRRERETDERGEGTGGGTGLGGRAQELEELADDVVRQAPMMVGCRLLSSGVSAHSLPPSRSRRGAGVSPLSARAPRVAFELRDFKSSASRSNDRPTLH